MAAPTRPTPTKAFGAEKWSFVPTIANTAAPTLAEVNAAGALDVTKMFFASSARPDASANLAKAERRLGDVESFEFVGETSYTMGEVRYSFNPQGAALSTGVLAFEKLPQGTTGFLVRRLGINRDTDYATGQFVSVFPVEFGPQVETTEGDGESAEVAIKQGVAVTGPPALKKALA
jgi:hypothetical protein